MVEVIRVETSNPAVRVEIRAIGAGAFCPGCEAWSERVHSSYLRFPADLPSVGRRVVLALRVRRFTCPDGSCPRRTFVEQVQWPPGPGPAPGARRRHPHPLARGPPAGRGDLP
ncbi:transposase family protein [Kitasatospora cinereorecta]|uniref:Transposase family protein n=1 Tax=Kitasatospora cinereorecta TaxID=285560 RepID=A0ABW0VH61_9ACTN